MGKRTILASILLSFSTAGLAQKAKPKKAGPAGERGLWREPADRKDGGK